MHHFFVTREQIQQDEIVITGPDVNHIRSVLRMRPGQQIRVSDGRQREYLCSLEQLEPDRVLARILSETEGETELPARITLLQGLPKGDKMELIVQKAVELGAFEVVPVAMERSVVKLDARKAEARIRRWNGIAESAAKQSGRVRVPQVTPVMTVREALDYVQDAAWKLLPYENARGMESMKEALEQMEPGCRIAVWIGPEGGFEETEVEQGLAAGFRTVSLGRRILRTETAGIAALSILMFWLEAGAFRSGTGSEKERE